MLLYIIFFRKEDVERCKNKDLLEELLKEMAGEFPQLTKIFVEERDLYMVHILRTLMQKAIIEKWNTSRYENSNIYFKKKRLKLLYSQIGIG